MTTSGTNVAMRLSDEEKAALLELATRFHRSQTDIIRVLVTESLAVLKRQDAVQHILDLNKTRPDMRRTKAQTAFR